MPLKILGIKYLTRILSNLSPRFSPIKYSSVNAVTIIAIIIISIISLKISTGLRPGDTSYPCRTAQQYRTIRRWPAARW